MSMTNRYRWLTSIEGKSPRKSRINSANKSMKAAPKTIPVPKPIPDQIMRIEDRIVARALALWHGKGRARRNAVNVWLQVEREPLAPESKLCRSVKGRLMVKTD